MDLRKLFNRLPKSLDIDSISYDCDPNDFEVTVTYPLSDDIKALMICHLYFEEGEDTLRDYAFNIDHWTDSYEGVTHEVCKEDVDMIHQILSCFNLRRA